MKYGIWILFLLVFTKYVVRAEDFSPLRGMSEEVWLHNQVIRKYIHKSDFVSVDVLVNADMPNRSVYKKSVFKDHQLVDEYFYETDEYTSALIVVTKEQEKVPRWWVFGKKRMDVSMMMRLWDLSHQDRQAQYIPRDLLPELRTESLVQKINRWARHIKIGVNKKAEA